MAKPSLKSSLLSRIGRVPITYLPSSTPTGPKPSVYIIVSRGKINAVYSEELLIDLRIKNPIVPQELRDNLLKAAQVAFEKTGKLPTTFKITKLGYQCMVDQSAKKA